ncbi:MAG TPA: ABC transporter permease [Bryobacteraceae bacterium]|nr:ABC transporter permease [Bryobacteraceae bacterium]
MHNLVQEIRHALRGFRKNPVLAGAALISLALGIGANTAIFSLTDQVLLRSLPVRNPDRLVLFSAMGRKSGFVETNYDDNYAFSYPMYCDFRDRAPAVAGVLARFPLRLSMSAGDRTELVQGELVSGTYFSVLGAHTVLGRPLTPEDDRLGSPNDVAVLAYNLWKTRFALDPSVLNQTIRLNGRAMTIVGVAQAGFKGAGAGESADVFVPITMQRRMTQMFDGLAQRRGYWLNIFARLKPGVSRQQAESALNVFWHPILEEEARNTPSASQKYRQEFAARQLKLMPGGIGISGVRDQASGPLMVLMCMAGLLLLIACANIANLLIARAAGRRKEIAIRLAIGAGRGRLLRQLLTEGITLSLGGGLLGVLTAYWTGDLLLGFLPSDPSMRGLTAQPDVRVLMFALALSIITGIIFGLAPVWETLRADVAGTLKEQAAGAMGSAAHVRFRKVLVIAQIGLSLVLLIGAGLFARSLFNLKQIDPGFRANHLLTFAVQPSLNGYDQARTLALYDRLRDEIAALPQVRGVAMAEIALLSGNVDMMGISIPGYEPKEGERQSVRENFVGPGYLSAMGIPLLTGREITRQDGPNAPRVAVVNEQFARKYYGGESPLGRRFHLMRAAADDPGFEIIGVVKDGKHADLREQPQPFVYYAYAQHESIMRMNFYVRTARDPTTLAGALRDEVRRADPNLPVFDMKTMDQQINEDVSNERLVAVLSTFFGMLATLLAAVGLYGVMAYAVARRTREIGLRMALGAARSEVLRMVMREVGLLAALGVSVALPAAYAISRLVQTQLYNMRGSSPAIFAAASLAIVAVAAAAGLIPAVRATRIDPMMALRNE